MAKAGLLESTSNFRSQAFDTREARNASIGSLVVSSIDRQPRDDRRNQRYKSRAQQSKKSRTLADAGSEKNPTTQCRSAVKKNRLQHASPRFPEAHRNHGTRAEAISIGIALGSPSDNPLPPLPVEVLASGEVTPSSVSDLTIASSVEFNTRGACVEPAKSRARRWHTFGGIFGKKNSSFAPSPNLPVSQMQRSSVGNPQQDVEPPQRQAGPPFRSASPQRTRPARANGGIRAGGPHMRHLPKREVKGLRMPGFARAKSALLPQTEPISPTPPPKDINYTNIGPSVMQQRIETPPRLHVEIPNVMMERYSVMFGSLLNGTQPSSLLTRRHGHLGRLTNVGEGQEMVDSYDPSGELSRPARRATSPTVKSPSFSLFPSTSPCSTRCPAKAQPYRPSPLQRAVTAPGAQSPDQATLNLPQTELQGDTTTILDSPETAPASLRGPKWSWGTSHLSQVSSESSLDERDLAPEDLFRQVPPMNIPRSKCRDKGLSIYPPIIGDQSRFSNAPSPHKAVPSMRETSAKATNAAEVLTARQISISAQQRRLPSNLVPKTARQPVHPVLVDVRNGLMVRNSHHVLLEEV